MTHYIQIRGSDFSFKELMERSGKKQKEVGRLLGVVNSLITILATGLDWRVRNYKQISKNLILHFIFYYFFPKINVDFRFMKKNPTDT
jgi:hypothetical protein